MVIVKDKHFIEKIKERASNKLGLEPVFYNTDLELETKDYLKKQAYLDSKKVEEIIKNRFNNETPFGYVLKNKKNEIVGFMGTIFSFRNYDRDFKLCNVHTWIINEEYRYHSYLPLIPLVDENYSITAFTPIKSLSGLLEKFGFEKIKMNYRVILLFSLLKKNNFLIETNDTAIEKLLKGNDLKIYKDYKKTSCLKFVIIDRFNKSENIFVIGSKKRKKFFNILDLLYVSNNKKLKKIWPEFSSIILKKFKILFCGQYFLIEEETSIPKNILFSKNKKHEICMKNLSRNYVFDTLYSELI